MKVLLLLYTILQIAIFIGLWIYYLRDPLYKCPCKRYDQAFPIAKSSGFMININIFITLLSSSNILKRFIYISSETFRRIHVLNFIWLTIFSVIHTITHVINFTRTNRSILNGTGITGLVLITIIATFSVLSKLSQYNYNFMIRFHIFLVIVLFIVVCLHGSFCSIRYTLDICPKPTSWIWILCGGIIYVCNFVFMCRKIKSSYSDNLLCVKLDVPKRYVGKTVWILLPCVSLWEWHPFTVVNKINKRHCIIDTMKNSDSRCLYIKVRGDWTQRLAEKLDNKSRYLLINGPYQTLPTNFSLQLQSFPTILIASGTGITSFIDTVNSINVTSSTKISVIVIIRTQSELELVRLLDKRNIDLTIYITQNIQESNDNDTNLYTHIGRPDFNDIFDIILLKTSFSEGNHIRVYFSGSRSVYKTLIDVSRNYNDTFCLEMI